MTTQNTTCHVCGAPAPLLGVYHPYSDVEARVFDCRACGSLVSPHDEQTHLALHSQSSSYDDHYSIASECQEAFKSEDKDELRDFLFKQRKFQFIIETIERSVPKGGRVLEVGCSTGALGSWFIANGYDYLGVDIAAPAVNVARECFGDAYFATSDEVCLEEQERYDAVFHAGTIGCVDAPFEMTRSLLKLLKPEGLLVFNAPNRQSCIARQQLWVEGTHPPDLVSLFTPELWQREFGDEADVAVEIDYVSGWHALRKRISGRHHWSWVPQKNLFAGKKVTNTAATKQPNKVGLLKSTWRLSVGRVAEWLFGRTIPSEFGIFVQMSPSDKAKAA